VRVLIAGCGDVGTALGQALAAEHEIWGLRRRPEGLPRAIRPVAADLGDPATLTALPQAIDAVVYLPTPDQRSDEHYRRIYLEGARNLIGALARLRQPPARFVFVSSTSVYGECCGGWVDEDSPAEPGTMTGNRLLEAERAVSRSPFASVCVRFGGIYGPGREALIRRVREKAPCVADSPQYTNRIHRDDCAGVLAHLLSLTSPAPLYLGVDDEPAAECAVMDFIAERLGLAPVPRAPGDGRRRASKRCSNRRLKASGYRLRYPTYREGYAAVLAGSEQIRR